MAIISQIFILSIYLIRKLNTWNIIYNIENSSETNSLGNIVFSTAILIPAIGLEFWRYSINLESYAILKEYNLPTLSNPEFYFYEFFMICSLYLISFSFCICKDLLHNKKDIKISDNGLFAKGSLIKWDKITSFNMAENTLIIHYKKNILTFNFTKSLSLELTYPDKYFIESLLYTKINTNINYVNSL